MVIFGATGDLVRRKLMPALFNLMVRHQLPQGFTVVGGARTETNTEGFRTMVRDAIDASGASKGAAAESLDAFLQGIFYVPLQYDDMRHYQALEKALEGVDADRGTSGNRLYYCATPPSASAAIVGQLGRARLGSFGGPGGWRRIVIEKPFGHDLESARALNFELNEVFSEDCVYRIDHYLGKETVQNLLVFRFANTLVERIWNRDVVASVQLTVAEDIGVENRGRLYEETGALRDIVQNHMFQLLALTCMSPPSSFDPEALRDEKVKVLHSIRPVAPADVVRGQYTRGSVNGKIMPGYRELDGVSPDSATETYIAMRLAVDSWEWAGVPFYLRCGKALTTRRTEIMLYCRDVPLHLFEGTGIEQLQPNRITLRIQPEEGISFSFEAKQPGPTVLEQGVRMDFSYGRSFKTQPAEAYERLLHDALLGDHTLFIRQDETEAAWKALQPVLDDTPPINLYAAGSQGPTEAEALLRGGRWHDLSHHVGD